MFISEDIIKKLFVESRTHSYWQDKQVDDHTLEKIYDIAKFAPTSANCLPLRILFVKTKESKEILKQFLLGANVNSLMQAPVCAIFGYDLEFYEKLPYLYPHVDAKSWFDGNQDLAYSTAFRNSTLQAAYFMIAAKMFGLDCGPMSGFDNQKVDEVFFKDTKIKSNFICCLGYGDDSKLHPRNPRLLFNEVCKIV
jgi:3-hydroxypropanoate dehydrogenase